MEFKKQYKKDIIQTKKFLCWLRAACKMVNHTLSSQLQASIELDLFGGTYCIFALQSTELDLIMSI